MSPRDMSRRPISILQVAEANGSIVGVGLVTVSTALFRSVRLNGLIGESVPVAVAAGIAGEIRVAEAVAANAGGSGLTLLHRGEAAAGHVSAHVLAAEFAGSCAAGGDGAKNDCGDERRSRQAEFVECSHLCRLIVAW